MKTRRRRCGAPTPAAESTPHSASYPAEARSRRIFPKNRPSSLESSPGTFSATIHRGRVSQTSRYISPQRVDLFPLRPARAPATETSWQGKPPQITSTVGGLITVVMSVNRSTFGQCLARTFDAYGSSSICHLVLKPPVHSRPNSRPPIPLKHEPTVSNHVPFIPSRQTSRLASYWIDRPPRSSGACGYPLSFRRASQCLP